MELIMGVARQFRSGRFNQIWHDGINRVNEKRESKIPRSAM